ncbi:MAG: hypothetical protein Q9186_001741 [Xanthomendoza sp. 1 TL-2023]
MVQRLAKGVLPPNTIIQKDAVLAMCKGATVFVNHIADKANELTLASNRKTITPGTTLDALADCEFDAFLPRVKAELAKFEEIAAGKRNEYRRKIKEKDTGVNGADGGEKINGAVHGDANGEAKEGEEQEEGEERARKRVRREEGFEEVEAGKVGVMVEDEEEEDEDEDERYDTAMEEEESEVVGRRESTLEEEGGDEGSGDGEDEEEEEVEEEEEDGGVRTVPDGLSSGTDEGSEESD